MVINVNSSRVQSPLKWAGAKHWLAKSLTPLFYREGLNHSSYLIEPFAGSLSFYFSSPFRHACLNDVNRPLMHFWQTLQQKNFNLAFLDWPNTKSDYLAIRDRYNQQVGDDQFDEWLFNAVVYLNTFGYNGLMRTSKKTGFNVPYGRVQVLPSDKVEKLYQAMNEIQGVQLTSQCFQQIDYSKADIIYCDPPYTGTFTSYSGSFTEAEQYGLANLMARQSVPVIISNSDKSPTLLDCYRDLGFKIYRTPPRRRQISQAKNERQLENEIVAFHGFSTKRIASVCRGLKRL